MPTQHVRHVLVRVPWHDAEWNGHVCDDPIANSSCLALRLIAENRDDGMEQGIAKEAFDGLAPNQMPPCLRSSAAFLSPHPYTFQSVMEYSKWSRDHKHIPPRAVHLPAFGGPLIPYRWMLKDSGFQIAESLELDAHAEREPEKPLWLQNTSWVQHQDNQRTLFDAFAQPLIKDETLVFFYAPRTPLCDDERRAILGVAFLETKSEIVGYPYEGGKPGDRLQAMV